MSNRIISISILICLVLLAVLVPLVVAPNIVGPNYKNVTVRTEVNITNSRPEVLNVTIYEADNSSRRNITLNAESLKIVTCNVTVRDWNGYSDVPYVNATLWHMLTSTYTSPDDNNTHYTNTNCTNDGNGGGFLVNYICNFTILYYANNCTWVCNATAVDNQSTRGFGTGNTTFYAVYALNVTDGIDYGSLAVEEYSGNVTANITNLGNMAINITVEGYGARKGDGLAMNCSMNGNITIYNERFAALDIDWDSKIPLNGTAQKVPGMTMAKQNDSNLVINSTYWQLYVNSTNGPGGNCTGYVIFTATVP